MKQRLLLALFLTFSTCITHAQVTYFADLLGKGFKQATLVQPSDYEGSVTCTIVKKTTPEKSVKAVLYIHGFNDYFFQEEMAERYIKEGFNFYALDLRKCGRSWLSHQQIGNVRDLSEYYADIDTALAVMKNEGNEKVLLSAHSLGGLVASLYASERLGKEKFDALLLNSPLFALNIRSGLKKTALPLLVKRAEKHPETSFDVGITPLYGESLHITAHGEWSYSLGLKPHIAPPVNLGWVRAVFIGQERITQGIQINKPVLVLHSAKSIDEKKWSDIFFTGDAVLNVDEVALQARNIIGQYSIQAVQGGMHDLILSKMPVRDEVYSTIFNWARRTVK